MPHCAFKNCVKKTYKSPLCNYHSSKHGLNLSTGNFKYTIKKSNIRNAGNGLFLSKFSKPIPRGKIIPVYSGKLLKFNKKLSGEYILTDDNKWGIDAKNKSELPGRYANDCTCSKNRTNKDNKRCNGVYDSKLYKENVNGKQYTAMSIRTTKRINPGDEILVNYGYNYWK